LTHAGGVRYPVPIYLRFQADFPKSYQELEKNLAGVEEVGMYALTPAAEIHARIAKLQAGLRSARLDAAFLVQNADLFYFTGSIQQGILVVPAEGEPVYFVRRVFERAVEESPLSNVRRIASPKEVTAY